MILLEQLCENSCGLLCTIRGATGSEELTADDDFAKTIAGEEELHRAAGFKQLFERSIVKRLADGAHSLGHDAQRSRIYNAIAVGGEHGPPALSVKHGE